MKKQLKIGAYIRVSTDKQVQVFEGSLDTQKYRMQDFVKSRNKENRGWGEIVDFYVEEGFSAGTVKRPQYQRLMSDVRSGKVNLILVADISRLSRNVHDFSVLLKDLEKYNASYMSLKEQFDTTTPAGRLMTNMVVTMAQFEREQTSERVSINCNSRAMRGLVNGGRPGIGFRRDPEKRGTLVIDEIEAENVRTMFRVYMEQGSIGKTLPIIEAMGIVPKSSGPKASEFPTRKWNYSILREVLLNPAYIGLREVNKMNKGVDPDLLKPWQQYQLVKATWSPIVDEKTFASVQTMLEENMKIERRRLADAESRIFLLSGILKCGECGRPLCGQSAHGSMSVHRYYGHADKRVRTTECSVKRVRANQVEQVVINHFTEAATRAGYFDRIEKKLASFNNSSTKQPVAQESMVRQQLRDVEKEIATTFRMQAKLEADADGFDVAAEHLESLALKKRQLKAILASIESNQVEEVSPQVIVSKIEDRIKEFKRGYAKGTPSMKRRLLRRILKSLILTSEGLEVAFNVHELEIDHTQVREGKLLNLDSKRKQKLPPGGEVSSLSLLSDYLPIDGNGWGSRI